MSATTTFSRLPALKTMTSAMSSGVNGSQPLGIISFAASVIGPRLPVHCIGFGFVTTEANKGEFCLNLARVDLHYSDPRGDQLFTKSLCKYTHGCLGRTIYRATWVAFSAGDAPDIDDISSTAFIPLLEDRQDSLAGRPLDCFYRTWQGLAGNSVAYSVEVLTWVILINPVTFVEIIVSTSSSRSSGALATPFTRPLIDGK